MALISSSVIVTSLQYWRHLFNDRVSLSQVGLFISPENVSNVAFEPVKNLLKPLKSNALFPIFQPVECRGGDANLLCELRKRHFTPAPAQERAQLLIQFRPHSEMLYKLSFRMRNN